MLCSIPKTLYLSHKTSTRESVSYFYLELITYFVNEIASERVTETITLCNLYKMYIVVTVLCLL